MISVDFHLHTAFSDGALSPESLVKLAARRGVGMLAVTDHDCLDGLEPARQTAARLGIFFVNGVELNTERRGREIHILGLGFDAAYAPLAEGLRKQREDRAVRFQKMLDNLNRMGFGLDKNRVYEIAGKGSLGRPHLALALVEKKIVKTVDEAFKKYLGYGKPAWVSRNYWKPQDAVSAVRAAGGLAVLAHPDRGGARDLLGELLAGGLDGVEVYYPGHTPARIRDLRGLAGKHGLIATVGSDYHGINPGEQGPGCVPAPREVIDALVRIFGKGWTCCQQTV